MKRLLFIDDERTGYIAWGEPLQIDHGWQVIYVPGPREALEKLEAEEFDVAVIDRLMPDPTTGKMREEVGDELLEEIAARWRYVCPIMLTQLGNLEAAQRDTRYGAFRYFVKNISVEDLHRACEQGMQMQAVKQARDALLALDSLDEVIREVRRYIEKLLAPEGYRFAYLQVAPGGGLLLATPDSEASDARLEGLVNGHGFVRLFPVADRVLRSRQFTLRKKRDEMPAADGVLSPASASQLLVPVLRPDDPTQRGQTEVDSILWIESTKEGAFTRADVDLVTELAAYMRNALAKNRKLEQRAAVERLAEREGLLAEVAHRICNPLQIAQSTLDLIQARLHRGPKLGPLELQDQLGATLVSLEDAIQAASLLRSEGPGRILNLSPLDLHSLVEEVIGAFLIKVRSAACEVYLKPDSQLPRVSLHPGETRYVLNCLLDNALEAIERKRAATGGAPEQGSIEVCLRAAPGGQRSVLLSVRDNGSGIAEQDLSRIFDRYFTTKHQDYPGGKSGLGLWEARRFVEAVGGTIEARNLTRGGAEIRILLPACADDEQPREITL